MALLLKLFAALPASLITPILYKLVENKATNLVPWIEPASEALVKEASVCEQKPPGRFPVLRDFIERVVSVSKTLPITLLGVLVYLDRFAANLSKKAFGHRETSYRVLATALIVASKFLADGAPKNMMWASYLSPWFGLAEINTMERQFLKCLDYNTMLDAKHMSACVLGAEDITQAIVRHHYTFFHWLNAQRDAWHGGQSHDDEYHDMLETETEYAGGETMLSPPESEPCTVKKMSWNGHGDDRLEEKTRVLDYRPMLDSPVCSSSATLDPFFGYVESLPMLTSY